MVKFVSVKHDDPVVKLFMFFVQVAGATLKYIDMRFSHEFNLSLTKYIALKMLVLSGGTLNHSQLALYTNTKKHNITALVDSMAADKLVTTEWSKLDKRVNNVIISNKGRKLYEKARPLAQDMVNELMNGIEDKDVAEFERMLTVVKENLEKGE